MDPENQVSEEDDLSPPDVKASLPPDELKALVIQNLENQGFIINKNKMMPPPMGDKEHLRQLHLYSVEHARLKAKKRMFRYEKRLIQRIAKGSEINVSQMKPRLVAVTPGSHEEWLFRYAALHWSIPVSSGYGRRLRFLVIDEYNEKLIGIIGLGDPVYSLGDRDRWIGWNEETHKEKLHYVMDAFALGAVPPYSNLLCGKLVAMLCASVEVQEAFTTKYQGKKSRILDKELDPRLALITTTSALGRSSIYNRLRFEKESIFQRVGMTRGSGEFHFSNGIYSALSTFALENCATTSKQAKWGGGFRNKREVIQKSLSALGLSGKWRYHGVQREIFAVPLASNTQAFLNGEDEEPHFFERSMAQLSDFFVERWMKPRSGNDTSYREFDPQSWLLWPDDDVE